MATSVISGHTSGSILSQRFQYDGGNIISYVVTDRSGDGGIVTLAIVNAGDQVYIDYIELAGNESYRKEINIGVSSGNELLIISSTMIDYYVTLNGV
jgi:hypothetical protein